MQEVSNIEYAGSALSHLRISQPALYALLGLRSCSPTYSTDVYFYMDAGQSGTKHPKQLGSGTALDTE